MVILRRKENFVYQYFYSLAVRPKDTYLALSTFMEKNFLYYFLVGIGVRVGIRETPCDVYTIIWKECHNAGVLDNPLVHSKLIIIMVIIIIIYF